MHARKLFSIFLTATEKFGCNGFSFHFDSDENHTDTHKRICEAFPFETVIGRHNLLAVDVSEPLWTLGNRRERAGQTTSYWESNSAESIFTPSGRC